MSGDLILLFVFPFICAAIGYGTNVLAVKMIFRPHEPRKIAGITIQGVLPKHQEHFARMLAGIISSEFVSVGDLVAELDTPEVADRIEAMVRETAPLVVDALRQATPEAQRAMITDAVAQMAIDQIVQQARGRSSELVAAARARAEETIDLNALITEKIVGWGAQGLEEVLYDVSKKELDFIEYYGAIFGFFLGLFQWLVLQLLGNIALPIVGGLVGTVTNWLAIQMLFYPREPTRYLGLITYQGMFPRGQERISKKMGEIAARDLIVPSEIFGELVQKMVPAQITETHIEAAETALRDHAPQLFQMADALVPESGRPAVRARVAELAQSRLKGAQEDVVELAEKSLDVHKMMAQQVGALDKTQFEQLLRGLFEREEIYLIIYGGILGVAIGGLQLLLVAWVM
jgi:uncharacterized membrane protein YheB (UPF0754 family)